MTVYASSDIEFVAISGAGHAHEKTKNEKHMAVTCAACEPELLKMGWVKDVRSVPLTFDEKREAEAAEKDISRFEQLKVAEAAREASAAVRASARTKQTRNGSAS